jgi:hypothetical protein
LGDFDTEHEQFAVYPRRAPKWVLLVHPSDEIADLAVDPGAAAMPAGLPAPIGPKAAPMPRDHGLGFDHCDGIQNRGEQSEYPNEDQPVDVFQPHPRPRPSAEDDHLLTQNQNFSFESRL